MQSTAVMGAAMAMGRTKSLRSSLPHAGTVYTVAGASGKTSGGLLNHPAMFVSFNTLGSIVLDVDGDRLDALYLDSTVKVISNE